MRFMVIGGGSIGMLLAGKLAVAGASVDLVCRTAAQAERIAAEGLRLLYAVGGEAVCVAPFSIQSAEDAVSNAPPPVRNAPLAVRGGVHSGMDANAEWALLAVKQTHWDDALLAELVRLASAGTRLVCFQNGLGHIERLAAAGAPMERVYAAVTTEAARRESANVVAHTGSGTTRIGPASPAAPVEPLTELARQLCAAGFETAVEPDIKRQMWRKLLINAAINPASALFGVTNGELASSAPRRRVMKMLLEEAVSIAAAAGQRPDANIWEQVLEVCRRTSANDSSMLQDVRAGRTTEIEAVTGSLLREAAAGGVSAPLSEAVYQLVKAMTEHP